MSAQNKAAAKSKGASVSMLKMQIDNEVTRSIRQHARAHMQTEVCGVLIGDERNGVLEVQASIQASSAAQAGTHVTFTQDAWEEIYKVKDKSYPDERIVGWYHSHPGFGVFLSEHDSFIHSNFFSSPNQVAWVYDPHTDEEGCFGWFNGEIHRIPELAVVDLRGDGEERTPASDAYDVESDLPETAAPARKKQISVRKSEPLVRLALNLLSIALAMAAGFAVCFFLVPSVVGIAVDPTTMEPIEVMGRPVVVMPHQFLRNLGSVGVLQQPLGNAPSLPSGIEPLAPTTPPATPAPASATTSPQTPPAKPTPKAGASR